MVSYKDEVKGNTVAYVHRNLDESANLVAYKGEVTGSVWSLSPFPSLPQSTWTRLERIPHLAVHLRLPGEDSLQQLACYLPLPPMASVMPPGHEEGEEHAYDEALLS